MAFRPPPPPPPPETVIAAEPDHVWLGRFELASVRPVIVNVVVAVVSPRFVLGEMVMIASGIPSLFSSMGSSLIVAFGKATPLTTTVVGSMSVTGLKGGEVDVVLNTKIFMFAGVVALTTKGPKACSTPICVVIDVEGGIGRLTNPPSTINPPPALIREAVAEYPGAPTMKSPLRSLSAVTVCDATVSRPETDAPKFGGEVAPTAGVVAWNRMPERGAVSAFDSENVPRSVEALPGSR